MSGPGPGVAGDQAKEISLASLASVLLRRRRLITGLALGLAVVAGLTGVLTRRTWTSSATFMPQGRRSSVAGLSGIAAQLGVSIPTGDAGQGPGFYSDFIASRTMLGALADTAFLLPGDTGLNRVILADTYRVRGRTPALRREALIRKLGGAIVAVPVLKTGVVRVRATAPSPELAQQMMLFVLDQINRFNLVTRQSQGGAERRFMEARLNATREELRAAEDRLQDFLERNRDFRNSPVLAFEQERLAREVQGRQQVYTALSEAYEQAKIEEVRDTPVITVVVAPELAARPDSRGVLQTTVVALVGGGMLGVLLAFLLTALERERESNPVEMLAVEGELREAVGELRRPWHLFRRDRSGE